MRILSIIPLLTLSCCGRAETTVPKDPPKFHESTFNVTADLLPYVDSFLREWRARKGNVVITDLIADFDDIEQDPSSKKTILGICTTGRLMSPTVTIDPTHWKRLSALKRESLMYHELGHCVLGRPHVEDIDSYMNSSVISDSIVKSKKSELLDELFDNSGKTVRAGLTHDHEDCKE